MIIGLTGKYASGKGEIAKYLTSKGFHVVSLSDVLREEVRARGLDFDRETLIRIGQLLRQEEGPGVLAKRLLARLTGKDAVDSIRHPEEIRVLKAHDVTWVIGVDADPKLRFERMRSRNRFGDAITFETFVDQERREDQNQPNAQQLGACLAMADGVIRNDGDLKTLHHEVDRWLENKRFMIFARFFHAILQKIEDFGPTCAGGITSVVRNSQRY